MESNDEWSIVLEQRNTLDSEIIKVSHSCSDRNGKFYWKFLIDLYDIRFECISCGAKYPEQLIFQIKLLLS